MTFPSETVARRPTYVTITGQGKEGAAYAHLVVDAQPFSTGVVVLDHRGSATLADNVELLVGDSANLTVVSLADWDDDTVHLSSHQARIGRDAMLKHVVVTLGGDVVRITPSAAFAGTGRRRRDARHVLRRQPASTRSTGCSSTTPRPTAAAG